MREILFRGKREDTGKWVYGYFYEIFHTAWLVEKQTAKNIDSISYEVDPETVGQYTGLTDKNGAKIFEGDIVLCRIDNTLPSYIIFENGCFLAQERYGRMLLNHIVTKIEVIGNIHDNPELLEVLFPEGL